MKSSGEQKRLGHGTMASLVLHTFSSKGAQSHEQYEIEENNRDTFSRDVLRYIFELCEVENAVGLLWGSDVVMLIPSGEAIDRV